MNAPFLLRRVFSCLLLLSLAPALTKGCGRLPGWPWPVVLLPLLILAGAAVGLFLFALVYAFLVGCRIARVERRQRKRNSYQLPL